MAGYCKAFGLPFAQLTHRRAALTREALTITAPSRLELPLREIHSAELFAPPPFSDADAETYLAVRRPNDSA
jgi:hypothetical protein